eukprot:TRINITY_DN7886_c0_g4_i1.p1 TRINITY_DN7886_c0_g4~~TRINITY_DN7886_c0_g4_i1.p1  ORF type:complete len:462 (+),score=54.93 TRINITY_DN7886_c0_g4_i1:53-1387(+)
MRRTYHRLTHATSFITDVEGNLGYFTKCIERSPLLRWEDKNGKIIMDFDLPNTLRDHEPRFVYGGDVIDKGAGGFVIMEALLDFKRRHPDKVALLAGNRDTCKTRLASEVTENHTPARPFWGKGKIPTWVEWSASHGEDLLSKFQYITQKTMGCPDLVKLHKSDGETDHETMGKYLEMTSPVGLLGEYLSETQLMVVFGDTLYTHGGVTRENIGFVPDLGVSLYPPPKEGPRGDRYDDVLVWAEKLNYYFKTEVEDWKKRPKFECEGGRGGEGLMGYTFSAPMKRKTVVTVSHIWKGMPVIPEFEVSSYLQRNRIRRVVTGHQPHGDCPGIFHHSGITFVMGDTSYSSPKAPDNRGTAHASITLLPSTISVSGTLSDEASYDYTTDNRPLVGRLVVYRSSLWWCKAYLPDGRYHLTQPTGWYSLHHTDAPEDELFPLYYDVPEP